MLIFLVNSTIQRLNSQGQVIKWAHLMQCCTIYMYVILVQLVVVIGVTIGCYCLLPVCMTWWRLAVNI